MENDAGRSSRAQDHARWVRISHWIVTASLLMLVVTGFEILMVHPRLYWGKAGNDLTPALLELPISRNYKHRGYDTPRPFFEKAAGPVSAVRTYDIFNQNGWGRSLHFLAAWLLVLPGVVYLLVGVFGGHFRRHIWPRLRELAPHLVWRDFVDHLRLRVPPAGGGPQYGLLQKISYSFVIFVAAPLMIVDRSHDVARRDVRVSDPAGPVRRLPVRPHDSLLHVRGARALRDRARRDGRQVRIPAPDPGHDRGGMT